MTSSAGSSGRMTSDEHATVDNDLAPQQLPVEDAVDITLGVSYNDDEGNPGGEKS